MNNTLLVIIFTILMLPSLVGIIIPVLPGIPLMFGVALVYGIFNDFSSLKLYELVILLALAIISLAIDYFSGAIGAKYGGASPRSTLYAIIGLIIGLLLFPPFGGMIGLFAAILLSEYFFQKKTKAKSIKAATSGLLGSLLGIVLNLIIGLIFIALFLIFALK